MQLFKLLLSFCLLALAYAQSPVGSSGGGDTGSSDTGGYNNDASASYTMGAATSKVTSAAGQATNKASSGTVGLLTPDWKIVGSLAALCVGGVALA